MARKAKSAPRSFIRCTGCASCCSDMFVPVNDDDVRRLADATGRPVRSIVRFYSWDDVEWPKHTGDWVTLRNGPRLMGLRRVDDRCLYLDGTRCRIYKDRPRPCRTYPVAFTCDGDEPEFEDDPKDTFDKCDADLVGKPADFPAFIKLCREVCRADNRFRERIATWNKERPTGTVPEFLAYIGLE